MGITQGHDVEEEQLFKPLAGPTKRHVAETWVSDEYRSVIDDLTIELQNVKNQLKRHQSKGPDRLQKEELFEVKVYGLSRRKKEELDGRLGEFASRCHHLSGTSSQRKGSLHVENHDHMGSASLSSSKCSHLSESITYADDYVGRSISTVATSSKTSTDGQPANSRNAGSNCEAQSILNKLPPSLHPRRIFLTPMERKELVVRRLERLFTGSFDNSEVESRINLTAMDAVAVCQSTHFETEKSTREATILALEHQPGSQDNQGQAQSLESAPNTNPSGSGGHGHANSDSSTGTSPCLHSPPEQRPTWPCDLDPHRVQIPYENMQYLRHLGLTLPAELDEPVRARSNVSADDHGWIYLNLLYNLAQLHLLNVTMEFVRAAVRERSASFQLSPDGSKIRWCNPFEGAKSHSRHSVDSHIPGCKRRKASHRTDVGFQPKVLGLNAPETGSRTYATSENFLYTTLFIGRHPPYGSIPPDDDLPFGSFGEDRVTRSDWSTKCGKSNHRKRRRDATCIYYRGAPFFTDLSGDSGVARMEQQESRNSLIRGSRLLDDATPENIRRIEMGIDVDKSLQSTADVGAMCLPLQYSRASPRPMGETDNVVQGDHFTISVTTKRPTQDATSFVNSARMPTRSQAVLEDILQSTLPFSEFRLHSSLRNPFVSIGIEYVSCRIRHHA